MDPACGAYTFSASVEDLDVANTITYAFFVDPEKSDITYAMGFIAPDGMALRSAGARATFNAATGGNPLFSPGTHVVQLVIGDTQFGSDRRPAPMSVFEDGGVDPGYIDVNTWVVDAADAGCP